MNTISLAVANRIITDSTQAPKPIVAGGVGEDRITAEFDAEWTGLDIVATFEGSGAKIDAMYEANMLVPWECIEHAGNLHIAFAGYTDGTEVLRTKRMRVPLAVEMHGPTGGTDDAPATRTIVAECVEATDGAERVNATVSGTRLTVTDRTGASTTVDTKGAKGDTGAPGQGVPSGGAAGKVLRKRSAADYDTEWADGGAGGGAAWGEITGTLANQADLQSALDGKQATIPANTYDAYGAASGAVSAHNASNDAHGTLFDGKLNAAHASDSSAHSGLFAAKQDALVSGTNIKTVNGESLLGSGDVDTSETFTVVQGTTTFADAKAAAQAGKRVVLSMSPGNLLMPLYSWSNRQMFFGPYHEETAVAFFVFANDGSWDMDAATMQAELTAGANVAISDQNVISATDTTYSDATTSAHGLMSAADKTKLDGVESGAEANDVTDVQLDGASILSGTVANIPAIKSNTVAGIVKYENTVYMSCSGLRWTDSGPTLNTAKSYGITGRKGTWYDGFGAITTANFDAAVKAAMCDGVGAAWTAAEQVAAMGRLGQSRQTATINVADWSSKVATAQITGLRVDSDQTQLVQCMFTDNAAMLSAKPWFSCSTAGTLTITCQGDAPTAAVTVVVVMQEI